MIDLCKMLQFILIWPIVEDLGNPNSVGLENGPGEATFGQHEVLVDQLLNSDLYAYGKFVRLSPELFRELIDRAGPVIQNGKTRFDEPLPAGLKVAITLRYLPTANSYKTLMHGFKVAFNTISLFVPDGCEASYQVYKEQQLKCLK